MMLHICPQYDRDIVDHALQIDIDERVRDGVAYILVVEDDPDVNATLAAILESDGHTLVRALDGMAGIGLARRDRPDLILMDLRLLTVDGAEAIRTLKADPETRAIPIIAVSAGKNLRAEADDLPVDAVVSKPFEVDALLAEVTIQLHRAGMMAPIEVLTDRPQTNIQDQGRRRDVG